ncbi:MAG: ABC transporter ATP-binding protein [Pirellulales bacterium]|nr:ABC transporter ATP-binding protein [Pirellulales bacterium]
MIRVVEVTQRYSVRPVLRKFSIEVRDGEIVALLGPNGMGKTTLLSVMAGALWPQKGHVEIDGLVRRSSEENELAIRRKVVFLPDQPWLPMQRTGREFLIAVGQLYDVEIDRLLDHADRLLKLFDLDKEGDWTISSYSNGQQKKIALCSALVTDVPIYLLDEPFAGGLDPAGIMALRIVLRRLVEEKNAAIVLSTPVPEIIEGLADRIAVIRDGQLAAFDTLEGLRRQTESSGGLGDVLAKLIHPHITENLREYFQQG